MRVALLVSVQLLHFLQQLGGALPAGAYRCGTQGVQAGDLAVGIHGGKGLLLRGHINVTGKRGADVVAETGGLFVGHGSILPRLRGFSCAGKHAGGHSVNDGHFRVFVACLTVFHFVFLLIFGNCVNLCTKFYHEKEENEIRIKFVEWRGFFLRHFLLISRNKICRGEKEQYELFYGEPNRESACKSTGVCGLEPSGNRKAH
nr:MAG TPA: hypothetical protein [Caudoviricetes sp.]